MDNRQNQGVPAAPSGHSPKGGAAISVASPAQPSVPNAVTISGELYAFLMGEGPLEGVWFGDMNEGYRGAFWWRALLRCAAGWPASGIETQSATTAGRGPQDESPTAATSGGDAQEPTP